MLRKAFLIKAKGGMAGEYIRRHNPIWPELKEVLKNYGINNYSIYLHQETDSLFGYFEVEDETIFSKIGESEIMRKWWIYMTEVLVCEPDNKLKAKEDNLNEVFHLD